MTNDDFREAVARADGRSVHALEQIAAHEKRCDARYKRIEDGLDRLQGRWFWAMAALLALLAGVLGYLLVNGRPWA